MGHSADRRIKLYRGTWCVIWRENGQTKRHSLRTKDRDVAFRNFEEYKKQLERKAEIVSEVIDLWLEEKKSLASNRNNKAFSKPIREFFGRYKPDQITRDMCKMYIKWRGNKTASIINELKILRAACKWFDPSSKANIEIPPAPAPRDIRITKDEYRKLINCSHSPHIKLFMILAGATAARVSALLDLTWDRVDFEKGRIQLSTGEHKNKRRALVLMTTFAREVLMEAYEARTCEYVIEFGSQKIQSIKKGFKNTAIKAGLDHISPHVLRHSAASWMAESGIPMNEIAQYLGHSSPAVTYKVYARYSPEYLSNAASALEV